MDFNNSSVNNNTDPPGNGPHKEKHRQGKGSRQKRTDAHRLKKNQEFDKDLRSGIFARLGISDPTAVNSLPLAKDVHPVTVPISFKNIPEHVDRVWDTMEAIGTRPFATLNTATNKDIFKKGVLILNEAKVCYAQRAHIDKPDEDLPSRKLYTEEELRDINTMASMLPLPIAMQLETVGNCANEGQTITPTLAEIAGSDAQLSGAITYSPRQMLPLLQLLYTGVCVDEAVYDIAQALESLPGMEWESFRGPPVAPAVVGPEMARITRRCFEFWVDTSTEPYRIKWTDAEYRVFVQIVQSMNSKRDFNVRSDMSHGNGSLAQVVQVKNWRIDSSCAWYTMIGVDDFNIKLGVAYGYSPIGRILLRPSRFIGNYTTSYLRGELTPRRVLNAILARQE